MENEVNCEDLDNFEAVVPYVDNVAVPLESYSLSSGRSVIGDLPLQEKNISDEASSHFNA